MVNKYVRFFVGLLGILLLTSLKLFSQSYGLGFNGQDYSKDLRTGLDLSPNGYMSFQDDAELRFKISLRPSVKMYFGFIVRIIDDKEQNVDLVFNFRSIDASSIEVVTGQNLSGISVIADLNGMRNKWTEFRLKFNFKKKSVSLSLPEIGFLSQESEMNLSGKIKIVFGANDLSHFKTSDLPSMKIKDISIFDKGKLKYDWPLDEVDGVQARDHLDGKIAQVKNPLWLKEENTKWQKIFSAELGGMCQIAFNAADEKIYFIGEEKMIVYAMKTGLGETLTYKHQLKNLLPGRQAIYCPDTKSIFTYDIDQKMVAEFDPNTLDWKQKDPPNNLATVFLHHNQYYSTLQKSMFVFGGYGQHEYRNTVQKADLGNDSWEVLNPGGDVFNPRYLASAGALNDTVFILGGYGSISGKQILSPRNFYDLMTYSLKDNKFKKVYDFVPPFEDICFSNSMVIDAGNRVFYSLSFPVLKYDTFLQLVKGSLQNPELKPIANKIPFLFHDVRSFSALYFCESSKKLIAATLLLNDQNQTEMNLFSIAFPPDEHGIELQAAPPHRSLYDYLAAIGLIVLLASLLLFVRFRKAAKAIVSGPTGDLNETGKSVYYALQDAERVNKHVNAVFFFGGFQVFDRTGNDITAKFTPLLKELFLVIWLFSIKNNQGISSEKLTELLWFDKEEHSAKNNRAVNIAKLKQIIAELDGCCLSHKTSYWKIETDESVVFNDYHECIRILNHHKTLTKEEVRRIIELTQNGAFMMNTTYDWLDEFKAEISNRVIDVLVQFASLQKIEEDTEFILDLADSVFNFDMVNEQALIFKCNALTMLGKHSIASNTFAKFAKDYKSLYNQPYNKSFGEIINLKRSKGD